MFLKPPKFIALTKCFEDRIFFGISKDYKLYYDVYYRWCDYTDYSLMLKLTKLKYCKPKDKMIAIQIVN